jgi:hypothetical protein
MSEVPRAIARRLLRYALGVGVGLATWAYANAFGRSRPRLQGAATLVPRARELPSMEDEEETLPSLFDGRPLALGARFVDSADPAPLASRRAPRRRRGAEERDRLPLPCGRRRHRGGLGR